MLSPRPVFALVAALSAGPEPAAPPAAGPAARPAAATSTCVEDDAVPTPPDYLGWDRSGLVAWQGVEQYGGIVPDIEEDRGQAPPAWWRYPSPIRSADLLAAEALQKEGLYTAVTGSDLKPGDLLVRAVGAGACGKMALVAGKVEDKWMTVEAEGDGQTTRSGSPTFFASDGKRLRPEASAYRVRVKKDSTLGHVRELRRDLDHLERTIAERPPLLAKNGRGAVDEKLHDLLDEAWSLMADAAFDLDRRALTGRVLALAAALDWPGAGAAAAAVLDDVLRRAPQRADAAVARASVLLLAGDAERAAALAEGAMRMPGAPARARYVYARALLASGKGGDALGALRQYLREDPADARARKLLASNGLQPRLAPTPPDDPGLRFSATAERIGLSSPAYDLSVEWPIPWRVLGQTVGADSGLLVNLATGRVLMNDGEAARGDAVVLAQRPPTPAARAALIKKGGRSVFPDAKLKSLPPLVPGSRREHFRERREGSVREGEVTTLERGDVVCYLVLNAPAPAYPKLKDEYAGFVKSLGPARK